MSHQAPGIFNDILGPVMRGPSSSHTAGSYHIALIARALLGADPVRAHARFDPAGSYARVYQEQGVDRAFALGLLGWPLTDARFFDAVAEARTASLDLTFGVEPLLEADHPNTVDLSLAGADGRSVTLRAKSVGGGAIEVTRVDDWPVSLGGEAHVSLVEIDAAAEAEAMDVIARDGGVLGEAVRIESRRRSPVGGLARHATWAGRWGSRSRRPRRALATRAAADSPRQTRAAALRVG